MDGKHTKTVWNSLGQPGLTRRVFATDGKHTKTVWTSLGQPKLARRVFAMDGKHKKGGPKTSPFKVNLD